MGTSSPIYKIRDKYLHRNGSAGHSVGKTWHLNCPGAVNIGVELPYEDKNPGICRSLSSGE
ncbi:hypothetical protein FA13DRAFT_1732087 [Coprinellus micaceus]|uniref:Uncharacterized protein n=1 Tax=Coprinellus micaceus TaxID=71717 RepID=A0A4Y7TCC2_COPMI|nr:hypothetical protein FA13DRAFT_1732087 [Coprinellus micaceus]